MEDDKKLYGVKVIGGGVLVANALGIVLNYIIPSTVKAPFFPKLISFVSMVAVFPIDLFQSYLGNAWIVHFAWIAMTCLCAFGILWLNKFARSGFIILNIIHIVILSIIAVSKFGQPLFLDYFFKLYFSLVVSGSFVGFITIPEVRLQFKGGEGVESLLWHGIKRVLFPSRLKELSVGDAKEYYNLGLAYSRLGRDSDAVMALGKAISLDSNNDNFHFSIGMIYLKRKEYNAAINAFKEAVHINPSHWESKYHLGLAYQQEGCDNEAISVFEEVSCVQPDHLEVYQKLGKSYRAVQRFNDAVKAFQRAIQLNPKDHDLYYQMGIILTAELGKSKEAQEALKKSIRLNPDAVEAYFQLGKVCVKLDRHKDAIRAFKETIRRDENHTKAHYQLGFVYAMIKDLESARREYKFLKTLDADLAASLSLIIK